MLHPIITACFAMKIDVSDLLKHIGSELKVDKSEELPLKDDDFSVTSPINVKLKLVNTGSSVLVTGTLKTKVKMCCCRCLKEYEQPISIKIEEQYSKKVPSVTKHKKDEEIELKEKDFVFEISEENIIDLSEAIRQNIIVALPIKPLCSRNCSVPQLEKQGRKKVDPRLAKLADLKFTGGK